MADFPEKPVLVVGEVRRDLFYNQVKGVDVVRNQYGDDLVQLGLDKVAVAAEFRSAIGGAGANLSIGLARFGLSVDLLSLLPQNHEADFWLSLLDQEAVSVEQVIRLDDFDMPTASHIINHSLGRQTRIGYFADWSKLHTSQVKLPTGRYDWAMIATVGGNFKLLNEIFYELKQAGVKIAFNPGPDELAEVKKLRGFLDDVDLLIVNKTEAEAIVDGNNLEELAEKLAQMVGLVVITDSADGSVVASETTVWRAGTYKNIKMIDKTGVGDAFSAAFLASFLANEGDITRAISVASANAAMVATQVGATFQTLHDDLTVESMLVRERSIGA